METPNAYFVYKQLVERVTLQFDRTSGRYVFVCCLPRKYFARRIVYGVSAVSCCTFGAGTRELITQPVSVVSFVKLNQKFGRRHGRRWRGRASQPVDGPLGQVGDFPC